MSASPHSSAPLAERLRAARAELEALAGTLDEPGWIGPLAPHLNPPLWEYGHVVWFQERWCLRRERGGRADEPPRSPSRLAWADWLYDSARIPHGARWKAPLASVDETRAYGAEVLADVTDALRRADDEPLRYFVELALYHERMHAEAWWMAWQWRGLAPPRTPELPTLGAAEERLELAAGPVTLGSPRDGGFVFDNEKWAHEVRLGAFDVDARPVTCGELAAFVAAGGYERDELWSAGGRRWLAASGARQPLYWQRAGERWALRRFERWIELPEHEPALHVSRWEAEAYAAWRGRRLPSAAEWVRAAGAPGFALGRCWEWTSDAFERYPGFSADPYEDYSVPWFRTHAELRGAGSWVTDAALARPTFRNFYEPDRRDPFVGFRTAASR